MVGVGSRGGGDSTMECKRGVGYSSLKTVSKREGGRDRLGLRRHIVLTSGCPCHNNSLGEKEEKGGKKNRSVTFINQITLFRKWLTGGGRKKRKGDPKKLK